jgi:predicted enzyme related to lactoylglutathione lyase
VTVRRLVFVLDCADPAALSPFWQAALGYQEAHGGADPYVVLRPPSDREGNGWPDILLQRVSEAKVVKNRMHLDMRVDNLEAEVERLIRIGARRLTEQPLEEEPLRWHVLADPEGNEFCVLAPLDT